MNKPKSLCLPLGLLVMFELLSSSDVMAQSALMNVPSTDVVRRCSTGEQQIDEGAVAK